MPDDLTPAQMFVAHKQMGLSDLDAALKARDALLQQAEARSSFRNAQDLFTGLGKTPLTGDALRAQLVGEANRPVETAQLRAQTGYAQALANPNHPANQMARQIAKQKLGVDVPDQATVYDLDAMGPAAKAISDYAKTTAEAGKTGAEGQQTAALTAPKVAETQAAAAEKNATANRTALLAPAEKAETLAKAGKTGAETQQVAPNAAAERELKGAEAGKAGAEAAHTRMLTSGEVVPGYVRGSLPIDEGEQKKLSDQFTDYTKGKQAIGEVMKILGDRNFVADPDTRAKMAPRIGLLMGELRGNSGVRQVAGPELHFLEQIVPDPNKITLQNILGLSKNQTRLTTLANKLDEDWRATVKSKGLLQKGAAPGAPAGATPARVNLLDSAGKPINLPATQVDDYLKANPGAKKAAPATEPLHAGL